MLKSPTGAADSYSQNELRIEHEEAEGMTSQFLNWASGLEEWADSDWRSAPARVGVYAVTAPIGEGGMGQGIIQ